MLISFLSPSFCSSILPLILHLPPLLIFPKSRHRPTPIRFHSSDLQPKTLRSRARRYLFNFGRAACPEESHSSICSSFFQQIFHGCYKLFIRCHWPRQSCLSQAKAPSPSGLHFLFHIFNLPKFLGERHLLDNVMQG